jgi:hypothetical protein
MSYMVYHRLEKEGCTSRRLHKGLGRGFYVVGRAYIDITLPPDGENPLDCS